MSAYRDGVNMLAARTTVGPRGRVHDVLGAEVSDWDKTLSYGAGAIVRHDGSYYEAQRRVDSASWLWGNDAPDQSDAWRQVSSPVHVLGADSPRYRAFDNHQTYEPGEIVTYWGNWWQAVREVAPPMFPSIMSGDVPGDSDAWRQASASQIVLGEALVELLGGASARGWDNRETYEPGDVVYSRDLYWRALRHVDPPFLPSLMSGEVPGESDAWRQEDASQAYGNKNVIGGDMTSDEEVVLGMLDMGLAQRNMNDLKPVTIEIARILLRGGQSAMAEAEKGAKQPWYKPDLPGETARKNVIGHLQWHADALSRVLGDPQTTSYVSGDDLKKWTMSAYEEANAVEEGSAALEGYWNAMWTEIETKLAAIPKQVLHTLTSAAGGAFEAVTGVPPWVLGVGIAAAAAGVGYLGYKIVTGPVGGAVAGVAARRYLP